MRAFRRLLTLSATAALLASLVPATMAVTAASTPSSGNKVVSAYFADWDVYGRGYFVKNIPADKINTLLYAFGKPTADGGCAVIDPWADYQMVYWGGENAVDGQADNFGNNGNLYGNFNQLKKLKALHPNLKVLISLGGWSLSTYFSDVAATPASRAQFVSSCIDTFIKGNLPTGGWPADAGGIGAAAGIFDGIDIDWEYPGIDPGNGAHFNAADRANATLLFKEFRSQLDALGATTGKHYVLAAALPAADVHSSGSYDLAAVGKVLDYANVMTYDFHGASDAYTAFNSPLLRDTADPAAKDKYWNVEGTIDFYRKAGFPLAKIVLGVPFYGKQYIGVGAANHGLYQAFDNTGLNINSLHGDAQPTPTYHQLVDQLGIVGEYGQGQNGYTTYVDWKAGEPWLWNPAGSHSVVDANDNVVSTFVSPTFISYETPLTILARTELVRIDGLRGVFAWEISQDSDALALTTAMGHGLLGH